MGFGDVPLEVTDPKIKISYTLDLLSRSVHTTSMGYTNKDKRYVTVTPAEKKQVARLRRIAEKRELKGENVRYAGRATKRGWYYA